MAVEDTGACGDLSLLWNRFLSVVSVGNLVALAVISLRARRKDLKEGAKPKASFLSWQGLWDYRALFTLMYVIACGVRSIWPRHDGDRACFYDHPISPPFYGRTLAFFAELSFCLLICMTFARIAGYSPTARSLASVLFAANVVAQNCCNFSVATQNQWGHVIEESIWLVSGVVVTAYCGVLYNAKKVADKKETANSSQAMSFLRGALLFGPCYVAFMATVDVPMYYNRMLQQTAEGRTFLPFIEGVIDSARCHIVTCKDEYWRVEMPWLTGYFTLAVWATLWIANADIPIGSIKSEPQKTGVNRTKKNE